MAVLVSKSINLASEIIMKRRHQRNERENKDKKDRLSDLPDCVLLHIFSFLNVEDACRTCILSTRWKHLWKRLPILNLISSNDRTMRGFSKFMTHILSLRDSSTALDTLDFKQHWRGVEPYLFKKVVRYAASHNVNHLRISCPISYPINQIPFPPSFSCPSLTSLDLRITSYNQVIFPNSLNLPALTYLKLHYLSFCSGNDSRVKPFSTFNKLNTLILNWCKVQDAKSLCISSTTLLNFSVTGNSLLILSGSHLSSIKQVSINIYEVKYPVETNLGILNWLIEMTNIKSLTVTPRTLGALSRVPHILKLKLTSLYNLKSLRLNLNLDSYIFALSSRRDIKMELARGKSWKENVKLREAIKAGLMPIYSSIIDGMIEFLLQNSPSANVEVVSVK